MEEKAFQYADKGEQVKRANIISGFAFYVYLICNSIVVLIAMARGIRTVGFTSMVMLISIIFAAAVLICSKNKKMQRHTGSVILAGLLFLGFLTTFAFNSFYMRFSIIAPLIVFILFYDGKFMVLSSVLIGIMEIITFVLKIVQQKPVDIVDDFASVAVVIFIMVIICIVERNGKQFQKDMLGSIEHEKAAQEKMMQDVIYVAGEVRKGTQGAMDIMNELNESTGVVTGAVRDISDSTQSTAENIQNQTVMTQNIQDSIESTIERSESMVGIAEKSIELNNANLEIMNDVKNQSKTIAETNANVAETMQALQERAHAVKGIADTIFAISSQTNLLALNASIESARAGEAGRGFAVVADEIRQLAEKTRTETENIASILDELSENAEQAVGAVAQSMEATNQQDELINKAAESFEEMNANVKELTDNIEEIDSMLTSLSEANNQIVDSITHLSATTEEVTASSAQAEGLSNQNLENADSTKEILDQVLLVSQQLDKYVSATNE